MRKEKLKQLEKNIDKLKTVRKSLVDSEYIQEKGNIIKRKGFLDVEKYECELANGMVILREKLVKGGKDGSAAIIIPITVDQEFLVVVEPRVFTEETVGIGFPAGYIERGENIINGALRKLKEETGYVPNKIFEVDSFYQDEGCSRALNHILLAEDCRKIYVQSLDRDEFVEYMLFNYDELFELERYGYIKGANSKLALEKIKTLKRRD